MAYTSYPNIFIYAKVPPLITASFSTEFFINPPTTTRFLLARHGETQWNKQKKLQGQLDSPLTPLGIRQANELGQSLVQANID